MNELFIHYWFLGKSGVSAFDAHMFILLLVKLGKQIGERKVGRRGSLPLTPPTDP
jgi:hypothetical protein